MKIDDFFFRIYALGGEAPETFLGSCFPITPGGGLLTCRHVVDIDLTNATLAVHDNTTGKKVPVPEVRLPADPGLDLAYLPGALPGTQRPFLPLLTPRVLTVGEEIYSYGFFRLLAGPIEQGYFGGQIVNFSKSEGNPSTWSLTLPFPVIEGMSGSPVLTYHNGPKVVGLNYGNRTTRVLASEVLEYESSSEDFKETIHRIVEFGLAYHCSVLVRFLVETGVTEGVVSDQHVEAPGLS